MESKKEKNNNSLYEIILFVAFVLIIAVTIYCIGRIIRRGPVIINAIDQVETMEAIVVAVNDKGMTIMKDDDFTIMDVAYAKEGNIGFKQGQEIVITYRGITPSDASTSIIEKIEITKQKSNVKIPDRILRQADYSTNNVTISVSSITNTGITYQIIDNNTIPYKYGNGLGYKILKKIRKSETEEYYIEEQKMNTSWKDTITASKDINNNTFERGYNWEKLYGKLEARRI